jgi:hypothetical protein
VTCLPADGRFVSLSILLAMKSLGGPAGQNERRTPAAGRLGDFAPRSDIVTLLNHSQSTIPYVPLLP